MYNGFVSFFNIVNFEFIETLPNSITKSPAVQPKLILESKNASSKFSWNITIKLLSNVGIVVT